MPAAMVVSSRLGQLQNFYFLDYFNNFVILQKFDQATHVRFCKEKNVIHDCEQIEDHY